MKFHILCINGLKKTDDEYGVFYKYKQRLPALHLHGLKSGKSNAPKARKAEEAAFLLAAKNKLDLSQCFALDETGQHLTSEKFAKKIQTCQVSCHGDIGFFIGGAYGLDQSVINVCQGKWAFGAMTWPHKLVQVMLAEQLYRATQILSGHPYHKA